MANRKKTAVKARNPAGAKRSGTEKGKAAARSGKQAAAKLVKKRSIIKKKVTTARKAEDKISDEFWDLRQKGKKQKGGLTTKQKKRWDTLNEESMPHQRSRHYNKSKLDATPSYHPPKKKAPAKSKTKAKKKGK
ncbi:MAG: hypothetical protein V3S13_03390 [Candidatus Omnitrophota bacterium]